MNLADLFGKFYQTTLRDKFVSGVYLKIKKKRYSLSKD